MKDLFTRGSWVVTVPLAGLALAYLVLVYPPGEKINAELERQLEQRQQYLAEAKAVTAALRAAQRELDQVEAYRADWVRYAPDRKNVASLYEKIQMLASGAGVTISRFDPLDPVEHAYLVELPLSVGCTGGFRATFEFLRRIELLPEEIWVRKVHFDKAQEQGENVPCQMDLVLFTGRAEISDYDESPD